MEILNPKRSFLKVIRESVRVEAANYFIQLPPKSYVGVKLKWWTQQGLNL